MHPLKKKKKSFRKGIKTGLSVQKSKFLVLLFVVKLKRKKSTNI